MPRKLRAWREPGVRFVVLRDNDGGDCRALKRRLSDLCRQGGRADWLVRIACQELEAWYLGEPDALADAYGNDSLRGIGGRARFRDPDSVVRPSTAVRELVPRFQKTDGARRMAQHLSRGRNRSASFQALIQGIENVWQDMRQQQTACGRIPVEPAPLSPALRRIPASCHGSVDKVTAKAGCHDSPGA